MPRAGQLMCLTHWRKVPRFHQMKVNDTWRFYARGNQAERQAYLTARQEAIDAVNQQEQQGKLI